MQQFFWNGTEGKKEKKNMEMEQLIKLVNTVSSSKLTEFTYSADGESITMKKEREKVVAAEEIVQQEHMVSGEESSKGAEIPEGKVIKSPLVGTFYAAPSEDAAPFVSWGDQVKKGQTVAIVEAMKLMNEIESEWDGVITKILVENGASVEYGQPLFCVE